MITEFGMSQKLGPRTFGKREELVFLGKEIHEQRNYSDKFAEEIDEEVEQLVKDAFTKALEIMQANQARLKLIADFLIEKETIDEFAFEELLNKPLPEPNLETATAS
jgi:cell division protease FtsH